MATAPKTPVKSHLVDGVDYPTSDGRPMAETALHRQVMMDLITTLEDHFAADPMVHVTGNLLLFYERGNKRKHIAPDVFVVRGVPKEPPRRYYLLWVEGRSPDVVIELTSKTTRREDQTKKLVLYREVLQVPEYFQFDPTEDYLRPSLQGFRLIDGVYVPITEVSGRLPSDALGLHLERSGQELRLYDPATGRRLLTTAERLDEARRGLDEARRDLDDTQRDLDEAQRDLDEAQRNNEILRREIERLRRQAGGGGADSP